MDTSKLAKKYFREARVLQIGTLHDGAPRVNSVYFVPADDFSAVYWMSEPHRRHSEDVLKDPRMSGAIAFKTDWPVAGLQFSGEGSVLDAGDELQSIIDMYNEKYNNAAKGLYERIQDGTNKHFIYKLTIGSLEILDGTDPVTIALR
jgi:uncharacterized protein YhbP (UPF0306 family)